MSNSIGFETLEIDHRQFADQADDVIEKMNSLHTEVTVVEKALGATGICVGVTDGRENGKGPTTIVQRAFQAFVEDPFEQQRDRVLAAKLKSRIVSVDNAGVSLRDGAKTSIGHKVEPIVGRMHKHAESQLEAIKSVLDLDDELLNFICYSLSTWSVAEMMEMLAKLGIKVGKLDMVEAVNDQTWQPGFLAGSGRLMSKIGAEDKYTNRYLEHNAQYDGLVQPYDRDPADYKKVIKSHTLPVRPESLLLGFGMYRGFAPRLLEAMKKDANDHATGISEADINFYRTDGSGVARQKANEKTVESLSSINKNTRLTVLKSPEGQDPHHHPIWHSVPSVAILADAMAEAAR